MGSEIFVANGKNEAFDLVSFWSWSCSDLFSNTLRGILAEYIISKAIGSPSEVREEWASYDLISSDNIKVEVKSASYIQSWQQSKPSKITFGIQPTYGWDSATNIYSNQKQRQSDVYVFCVFTHLDQATANPLDLDQWSFYIIPTKTLDQACKQQKTISLSRLLKLNPIKASFNDIHNAIKSCHS